jgi:hypothetical protein
MSSLTLFQTRFLAAFLGVAGALGATTVTAPVGAEPTYPGVIQQAYGGACVVQCTLCHSRPEGGAGYYQPSALDTGTQLPDRGNNRGQGSFFANFVTAINYRLPVGDQALEQDLKTYAAAPCNVGTATGMNGNTGAPCDSDGNGVADMLQLAKDQEDPNGLALCSGPQYGCGAAIKPLPPKRNDTARATAVLGLLGLGLAAARRLRRSR